MMENVLDKINFPRRRASSSAIDKAAAVADPLITPLSHHQISLFADHHKRMIPVRRQQSNNNDDDSNANDQTTQDFTNTDTFTLTETDTEPDGSTTTRTRTRTRTNTRTRTRLNASASSAAASRKAAAAHAKGVAQRRTQAGIIAGVICGVLFVIVAVIVYMWYRRKVEQRQRDALNERYEPMKMHRINSQNSYDMTREDQIVYGADGKPEARAYVGRKNDAGWGYAQQVM